MSRSGEREPRSFDGRRFGPENLSSKNSSVTRPTEPHQYHADDFDRTLPKKRLDEETHYLDQRPRALPIEKTSPGA